MLLAYALQPLANAVDPFVGYFRKLRLFWESKLTFRDLKPFPFAGFVVLPEHNVDPGFLGLKQSL